MVKYATALRLGTAQSEDILRRFTRNNVRHPTYRALAELGKARKTIFSVVIWHLLPLRREIHEGLNVIENWNGANDFILYGRGGEISTKLLWLVTRVLGLPQNGSQCSLSYSTYSVS